MLYLFHFQLSIGCKSHFLLRFTIQAAQLVCKLGNNPWNIPGEADQLDCCIVFFMKYP